MPSPKRWKRPRTLDQLTPGGFLVIEGRLLGRIPPPEPEPPSEDCPRYQVVGEELALMLLETLSRSYQPGDRVGYREVMKVTGYSKTHALALIHRAKKMELWPFVAPRGRGALPRGAT
jgi:hypothetical protein